jgi:DNA-directed RNA polymerase II subunit RPB2
MSDSETEPNEIDLTFDKDTEVFNRMSWNIIDKYFAFDKYNLVAHHLDSYNNTFLRNIENIFRDNNPIQFIERETEKNEQQNRIFLYMGGKEGKQLYFGKPIIYDEYDRESENVNHYMYPNEARLRNMTYGFTIHYDVVVDFVYYVAGQKIEETITLEKIYLGRFPIMLHSNLCILKGLSTDIRFQLGECRHDYGGYFIIDGKEKTILSQEKFADNTIYIRKLTNEYSHSVEIRSVSEDNSKPIRKLSIKMLAPDTKYTNNNILVDLPNVRKPIPFFIVMRALGVLSDKQIISTCLLDLESEQDKLDLFIPSIHDANYIFTQEAALQYIALFTKRKLVTSVIEILMNYLLPHIGELNFVDKAFYLGYMVNEMLKVSLGINKPTDRDNYKYKRIELSGTLIKELFSEWYKIQCRSIELTIDKIPYYEGVDYKDNFTGIINDNIHLIFKDRKVEEGFKKAFKGNWGAEKHTKRPGVIQDLNRLSYFSYIAHLRKLILPLDASAKVVGPRLINSSQWGYIDPIDSPDGANVGLHKHLSISTYISSGFSSTDTIQWLRENSSLQYLQECDTTFLFYSTKVFVNGAWIGVIKNPLEIISKIKLYKRNGILPTFLSASFDFKNNIVYLFTDEGRLYRPIYFLEDGTLSINRNKEVVKKIMESDTDWQDLISGFLPKKEGYSYKENKVYLEKDLYGIGEKDFRRKLEENKAVIDYIDVAEEEYLLIALNKKEMRNNKFYTNVEIRPSLIFGVLGNMTIYPENNPYPRDAFSCGHARQAVSVYHTNYQMRIDKMGVVLNYGEIPLIKSKYLNYVNKEEIPYGNNVICAIMSYNGYNVEDAILINESSIARGLFRTTYYTSYEAREESSKVSGSSNSYFSEIEGKEVLNKKPEFDYSQLESNGLIRENTLLNDRIALIGKVSSGIDSTSLFDSSIFPKKGQVGYVDKSFITDSEEGFRIAKIRIREERIPALGDKMASRAGQKGTIGIIIKEADMPFTEDGIRPDLIINPHAIPSRMTIGQLLECLFGKICVSKGCFGDSTAFNMNGPNLDFYGKELIKYKFHSTGNQVLYNGSTGEQLKANVFIGPTYYTRLKHMVKDKINYRARGPRTLMTRQTVQGRANDGGLRIGEMERDGVIAHGAAAFLNDSFMNRGDEYFMAICNHTGCIAVYNKSLNLFLSPFADGVHFTTAVNGELRLDKISRFGRSFSILRIPYSLKLLIHELQTMNVQMRLITDENIDRVMDLNYSNNLLKLNHFQTDVTNKELEQYVKEYRNQLKNELEIKNSEKYVVKPDNKIRPKFPELDKIIADFKPSMQTRVARTFIQESESVDSSGESISEPRDYFERNEPGDINEFFGEPAKEYAEYGLDRTPPTERFVPTERREPIQRERHDPFDISPDLSDTSPVDDILAKTLKNIDFDTIDETNVFKVLQQKPGLKDIYDKLDLNTKIKVAKMKERDIDLILTNVYKLMAEKGEQKLRESRPLLSQKSKIEESVKEPETMIEPNEVETPVTENSDRSNLKTIVLK